MRGPQSSTKGSFTIPSTHGDPMLGSSLTDSSNMQNPLELTARRARANILVPENIVRGVSLCIAPDWHIHRGENLHSSAHSCYVDNLLSSLQLHH
mmetsp:Transcript_20765/g.69346  ORF Transcript_20765/g.69346 Transcript_20765/m.69346 type:complete len:95 (-) Transcript_20765:141-425(-)